MYTPHALFRAEITAGPDGFVALELRGELDFLSMPKLETAVEAVLGLRPSTLLVDLLRATFVSVEGFTMLGRCSELTDVLLVRAARSGEHPMKILRLLGNEVRRAVPAELSVAARRYVRQGATILALGAAT